jgi:hypothetical protein
MPEEHGETRSDMPHTAIQSADGRAGHEDHAAMSHGGMHHEMKPDVTRPQLAVVGLLTTLALIASVVIPAIFVNLTYSAEEVGTSAQSPSVPLPLVASIAPRRHLRSAPRSRGRGRGGPQGCFLERGRRLGEASLGGTLILLHWGE